MISKLNRSLSATVLITLAAFSGLAQKPELVVQTGHSDSVRSVAFSPDGRTLASGSGDKTIRLWDVSTGAELRTLKGHSSDVVSVTFSPDGKTLASSGYDSAIMLWNVSTGAELRTLKGHSAVFSVAFSPDGRTLASGSGDKTIRLWEVSTGAAIGTLEGHSSDVFSVVFSPDGKTLASGSGDKTVKLWNVSTGAELRTLKRQSSEVETEVVSVAFSPDGKTLASGSYDSIKLWDVSTGTELRVLRTFSTVRSVAFSADGRTLANGNDDSTIMLWEVSTGAELRTLVGPSDHVFSVAFSPDGKTLASGSLDTAVVELWDVSTGAKLRTCKSHSDSVRSVAFSPDGKTLAIGRSDNTIKLWDVYTGARLRTLKGPNSVLHVGVNSLAFSPDGKTLASSVEPSDEVDILLWDVSTGAQLRSLGGGSKSVNSVAFSSDGRTLASGSVDGADIKLWDVSTGEELRTLKGGGVNSLSFSPDAKTLATGQLGAILWDVSTGAELRTLKAPSVISVVFSPDGKTLATGSYDSSIKLWDVTTGAQLRTLKGHSSEIESVAFSPDGKTLASSSYDNTIKLWDVSTGAELRTFKGHFNSAASVIFSFNNEYLVSGSADATVKVWEISSGKELASLIALDEDDWIVLTPDGLFDGSPAAWNKIIWRFNNNTFDHAPVEAFFNEFYYPGLLTDIFASKRPKAPSDISQKDRRQPQVQLAPVTKASVVSNKAEVSPEDLRNEWRRVMGRDVNLKIDISEGSAGAQDVRLFRNGSLVKVWRGDVLKGQSSVTLETTIPIVAGENRLTAYAFNHDNVKSSDATLTVTGADSLKRKGTAYILAVGVNEYANSQYNLKYAVADAQDFAAELKLQQAKLGNFERVEVISLNDRDATKANILKSLTELSAKIQPEDALIIYFAGHGTAQQNRFYLIPHDLGYAGSRTQLDSAGLQNILAHSVSDQELERAVEGIDAGQMLLVIDACNSGQALESEEKRRGPMNSKGLAQLAYEKGMYILTAAQSYQAAQEAARYGHGFLTYALVEEGLKTDRADRSPKDGQVVLREWLDYATERVPAMLQERIDEQKKQGRQLEQIIKFAETEAGAERSIQRPRVFYRRETETTPFVVARP